MMQYQLDYSPKKNLKLFSYTKFVILNFDFLIVQNS